MPYFLHLPVFLLLLLPISLANSCSSYTNRSICDSPTLSTCAWCPYASTCMDNSTFYSDCKLCLSLKQGECTKKHGSCGWCELEQLCVDSDVVQCGNNQISNGNFEKGMLVSSWKVINGTAFTNKSVVEYNAWKYGCF